MLVKTFYGEEVDLPLRWEYPKPGEKPILLAFSVGYIPPGNTNCPWPYASWATVSDSRFHPYLSARVTEEDIRYIVWFTARYCGFKGYLEATDIDVIESLLNLKHFVIPGSVVVLAPAQGNEKPNSICTGCCWGLESMGGFASFLEDGKSPWLGHDPRPYLQLKDNTVLYWSDCTDEGEPSGRCIEFEWEHYRSEVERMFNDAVNFTHEVDAWVQSIEPELGTRLGDAFRQCLAR